MNTSPTATRVRNASDIPSSSPVRQRNSTDIDPFAEAGIYYGPGTHARKHSRARTFSTNLTADTTANLKKLPLKTPIRRGSHDERSLGKNERLSLPVEKTIQGLIDSKDANEMYHITRDADGPKTIWLGTTTSNGLRQFELRGTYVLSNLMQELHLAKNYGLTHIDVDVARLHEQPTERLRRLIKKEFWAGLQRVLDGRLIDVAGRDPKDWTDDPRPRIYIPRGAPEQFAYYSKVAAERPDIRLDVCWLPEKITVDEVFALNAKPGLLALAMEEYKNPETGKVDLRGLPFIVPGGRFNELYGWDSYMEALGLIECHKVDLAKSMVQHFTFCIKHYGKILNANRSYYLTRSQPPFLTDMAIRVYNEIKNEPGALDFLRNAILAAIKEYHTVWTVRPRLDRATGLSRYRPEGRGVPPETEPSHFTHLLEPYAEKHNVTFEKFVEAYNNGDIKEPELDEYFLHDRAVRESGHDTSYRLEGVCANLATIDLNSLLYKYETDIAECIRSYFKDSLVVPEEFCSGTLKPNHRESSSLWERRAKARKAAIDKYLWNEEKGMYFDYDTVKKEQCTYESATTFWALWAGVAEPEQAQALVKTAIPLFEKEGGLVSGTEKSRGEIGIDRPNRQWDFPYGWAPQQILAWEGLSRYGHKRVCQRLAYRWLRMMISAFVDFHGVVVEKYDVTKKIAPHKVEAEYGNQGLDFKGVAREGFGWVNSSYILGYKLMDVHMRRAIDHVTSWEDFIKAPENAIIPEGSSGEEQAVDDDSDAE